MKTEFNLDYVLERVKRCDSYSDFQRRYFDAYTWVKQSGHLAVVERLLPPVSHVERAKRAALIKAYTDAELIADAALYPTREAWRTRGLLDRAHGEYSHYGAALHRGKAFMAKCCGHMQHGTIGNTNSRTWSADAIIEAASHYQHKGDWKRATEVHHAAAYQAARRRLDVFKRATAHMTPKSSPYAGDYVVYVFEFADRYAYVGLSFRPQERLAEHLTRGPVYDHTAICPAYLHRHVSTGIGSPDAVIKEESTWIERYRADGWTMLNVSDGGGLGTVRRVKEWTRELVLADARRFTTKQAWIDGSQGSYRTAKREGWFAEASAHMPKRVLGVGAGVAKSAAAKEKMRQAKLGVKQAPDAAAARTAASKATQQAKRDAVKALMRADPLLLTSTQSELMARYQMSRPTLERYLREINGQQVP